MQRLIVDNFPAPKTYDEWDRVEKAISNFNSHISEYQRCMDGLTSLCRVLNSSIETSNLSHSFPPSLIKELAEKANSSFRLSELKLDCFPIAMETVSSEEGQETADGDDSDDDESIVTEPKAKKQYMEEMVCWLYLI